MQWQRGLICLFLGSCLGAFIIAYALGRDPFFKKAFEAYVVTTLQEGLGCSFCATIAYVNLLTSSFYLTDLSARDAHDRWHWEADKATVTFSWLELLWHKHLKITIAAKRIALSSVVEHNKSAVHDHIRAWVQMPAGPLPVSLKALSVAEGFVDFHTLSTQATCSFKGELTVMPTELHSAFTLKEGTVRAHLKPYCSDMHGCCSIKIPRHQSDAWVCTTQLAGYLDPLRQHCFIAGTGSPEKATYLFSSDHDELHGVLSWTPDTVSCAGTFPLSVLSVEEAHSYKGRGKYALWASPEQLMQGKLQGSVTLKDTQYRSFNLPEGIIRFALDNSFLKSAYKITYNKLELRGKASIDLAQKKGRSVFANKQKDASLSTLPPCKGTVSWLIHTDGVITGSYALKPISLSTQEQQPQTQRLVKGSFSKTGQAFSLTGTTDNDKGTLLMKCQPTWHLSTALYVSRGKELIACTGKEDHTFRAHIACDACKELFKAMTGLDVSATGKLLIEGALASDEKIPFQVSSQDLQLRVPGSYTSIRAITGAGEYAYKTGKGTIQEGLIELNQGKIQMSSASWLLDEQWRLSFLAIPLLFSDCFVHWRKDIVGTMSGSLVLSLGPCQPLLLKGYATLDKMHIRNNVFSSEFERTLAESFGTFNNSLPHIAFEVGLSSRSVVHIKTPFLTTKAHMQLDVKGTAQNPAVSGMIQLTEGKLHFPYHPLSITQGKIYILPDRLQDPMIEFTAKGRIKNYTVTMHATGPLKKPHISFISTPLLTEEQIITLLLGGSEDGSLFLALPLSLTKTIEGLMFGSAESASRVKRYLYTLFKPFKNVRIVPRFGDELGRGGLRGSLIIEVNDNVRATIQKNFDLPEDVRIEVEYGLPNGLAVRGVKDERGDLGVELEKTWKFPRK